MKKVFYILILLIVFQLLLLLVSLTKGFHKYFLLRELNLLERYGGANSWVVITGASSGQGYEMALAFAERGFNLLLIGSKRTDETIAKIQKDYPTVKTQAIYKDFRQAFQDDFFTEIQTAFDTIGDDLAILVNNVGHRVGWNPYHEMNNAYIRDIIATGTIVQSRLTHMAIPHFLRRRQSADIKKSALINITAQCMHPNFLFGISMSNEISVPYLSIYEAANAFGFYQSNSIYKEYQGQFDILNITPGAVVTKNTECLSSTLFHVDSVVFVKQIMKLIGNVQGQTCAYWGHALSNYLINFMPLLKDGMLKKVGETIAADFMLKNSHDKYKI
jgi:17beta-estradiol 17-dehydrogenase / very-long-chain 3-oxoacyl-CoA reductase